MRWLLVLLALAVCVSLPATANAKVPCRNQVFNDWEHDGQISSKYPLACYRDALRHVPTTEQIYTSLGDDIRAAMQGAIARLQGKKVAPEIGHKFTSSTTGTVPVLVDQQRRDERANPQSGPDGPQAAPLVSATGESTGGGFPLPLLVLGGVALVLVASGAVGIAVRHHRGL